MKKIRIFPDLWLVVMASVWCLLLPAYVVLVVYAYDKFPPPQGIGDYIGFVFIYLLLPVILLALDIYLVPRWFSFVELDSEGMRLNYVYKRSPKIPYDKVWYFQIAQYRHIYSPRLFLVMGIKSLSVAELTHINQVQSSEELVKIQLSKRNIRRLLKILPEPQKSRVKAVIGGDEKQVFSVEPLKKLARRKELQRKRTTKWKKKK